MYRPPRPQIPHMCWGHPRYVGPPQWRPPGGPRAPFHGQRQRFHQPRQPFQPVIDNFWCETCDRGFPTEDILNKHKQQHQKCNIDGCQFIAHPKVITKHIQMQHSTGLYKKIANLKNPEEIEKWREERRKRYPTKSNIDKKAAELKEKIERGEKMGLRRERRHWDKSNTEENNKSGQGVKRRSNMRNENQPRPKVRKNIVSEQNNNKQAKSKQNLPSPVTDDKKLKPFAGILNLQMDSDEEVEKETTMNDLIEDEDCEVKSIEVEKIDDNKSEPVVCGALSALMCDYGSSDDEENNRLPSHNITAQTKQPKEFEHNTNIRLNDSNQSDVQKGNSVCLSSCNNEPQVSMDLKENSDANDSDTILKTNQSQQNKEDTNNDVIDKAEKIHSLANQNISDNNYQANQLKAEENQLNSTQVSDQKIKEPVQENHKNEDSDSGPEEIKTETAKEDNAPAVPQNSKPRDIRKKLTKGRPHPYQHRRPKLPSTLLHKLLSKEMQQERNIVLQCIRYICKNNYFDNKE